MSENPPQRQRPQQTNQTQWKTFTVADGHTTDDLPTDKEEVFRLNRDRLEAEAQARGFASPRFHRQSTDAQGNVSTQADFHLFPGMELRLTEE